MTIKFHPNIRNLMIGRGLRAGFNNLCSISVFKGTQPTAAEVNANWGAYNPASAKLLAHYWSASWSQPSDGMLLQLVVPSAQPVINSGEAAWCVLWRGNFVPSQLNNTTPPDGSFIVGTVSDSVGPGIIRFTSTTLTAGVVTAILDGSIGGSSL